MKETGNFDEAQKILKQAHTLHLHDAKTLELKGKLLFDAGRPQTAVRDYSKCAAIEPWNMECNFGKAMSQINMGKFVQGVKDLTTKGFFYFQKKKF